METNVVVDALPYIDHEYDEPGTREAALALVEEECRRYRPTKNYLDHLPCLNMTAFETKMMKAEFERIQSHQPMENLSMKRYELPPPPASKLSDLSAWQEAVENSCAQLEHQATRAMNLELMLEYGCESWKAKLEVLAAMLAKGQEKLQNVKKMIQDKNWERKSNQVQVGEKLKTLEEKWNHHIALNYEIEQHCAKLEDQIEEIRKARAALSNREQVNENGKEALNGSDTDENSQSS